MNIFVDCANYFARGSINLGDVAILRAMRNRLNDLFPHATVFVFTAAPDAIKCLVPRVVPVKITDAHVRDSNPIYARSVVNALKNADMVLLSGGGFFSDHFASHAASLLETLALAQAKSIPTAIMFAGFEPVQNAALCATARSVLPKIDLVGCRERLVSPRVIESFGVNAQNVAIGGDDAIEIAYAVPPGDPGTMIGFVLRQSEYSGVDGAIAGRIAAAVARAATRLRRKLVVLPTNLGLPSDVEVSREALATVHVSAAGPRSDSLESLFAAIDRCRFVVTGAYHTGVFALSRGRPVIALAGNRHYGVKFRGLAAHFGVGCDVIDLDDEFEPKLVEAIAAAENAAESLGPATTAVASKHLATQRALWDRLRALR